MRKSVRLMCLVLVLAPCLPAAADEVVPDDLIVQGSICAGLGCDEDEDFGSDPIRLKLKDNNLRIKFEDTSTTSSFPSNDWQLTANDSTNGGANKFSIEDITGSKVPFTIMAGAATNSIFVDSTGRIGIGTASPSNNLHVFSSGSGSTDGKVLIENTSGTNTGRELLELQNDNGQAILIFKDMTESQRWANGTFSHTFILDNQANSGVEFTFGNTGNLTIAGTLTQGSDRGSKTDIASVQPEIILAKVAALPIATWRYKADPSARHLGPMAQDFAAAFDLGDDERRIAPLDVASVSLAAIQALHHEVSTKEAEIGQLEQKVEHLQQQNSELAARLVAIESLLKSSVRPGT